MQYKSWGINNEHLIWQTLLMLLRFITFHFLKIIFMALCPGKLTSARDSKFWEKETEKETERDSGDEICWRFMAWFKLSNSQSHVMHLRRRCKQYVPDSNCLTDGVNHILWKIQILQLALVHNEGISNHVHHVHACSKVWNYISQSQVKLENSSIFFF